MNRSQDHLKSKYKLSFRIYGLGNRIRMSTTHFRRRIPNCFFAYSVRPVTGVALSAHALKQFDGVPRTLLRFQ